ncbi:hypothetical protein SAMN04487944_11657 [Gracilibacillus ureilyticus]|uniref:Uncharacterized protein n=1 Tax=Gracilibacillus ureilyticus TaxID=531814 RepID=A0A1H9U7P1_9BACI|nr:hypothetical protein [Gracilibacillus ureilyticus]SES05164.1 hypothetical protein SAMN04487944_11657 [Gracilibacillus ureilyticus]
MSDKMWKNLERVSSTIAFLTIGIMFAVFYEDPYQIKSSPLGIVCLGIILISAVIGLLFNYREKTGGITIKAVWYVISFLVAAYIMTIIVNRFF